MSTPRTRPCERCGKPLVQAYEGWRHTTYAKRGEICLHPSIARAPVGGVDLIGHLAQAIQRAREARRGER